MNHPDLPKLHELVIDLFAGGGGASTGIEQALLRPVDAAVNHNAQAISIHKANHPGTKHYMSDVFEVDPLEVTQGQAVGLLWASPDCTHFSKAKGGTPVSKKIRGLAWVVMKWIKALKPTNSHPRVIHLENVEEFQGWGPLLTRIVEKTDANGHAIREEANFPDPTRKGETFKIWVRQLEAFGYKVEWRVLRACDFGAPTIRKRLFVIARRDGLPIVWPQPTHGKPDADGHVPVGLQAWRTAADCIDWSIKCPSIFERKKPLAEATCRRIAKGLVRYVIEAQKPFIAPTGFPATLIEIGYGERKGQKPRAPGLDKPMGTVVASGGKHYLVSAFLAKNYTGVVGSNMTDPIGTVTSIDHHSLVCAHLIHLGHGEGKSGGKRFSHGVRDLTDPLNTITASGAAAGLVTSHLIKLRGDNIGSAVNEPLHTISAGGTHHGEVRALLVKYCDLKASTDLPDLVTVTINGESWVIVDIGMRMLTPRELYRAQGFPDDYQFEQGADGEPMSKDTQIRLCGNSVCPPMSEALVRANFNEFNEGRIAA